MKASETEIMILKGLLRCRFQPGSFDKKLPKEIDVNNISPRQQYYIYKLGYKYRKQIGSDILETICINYINSHPDPLTRKQAERMAKGCIQYLPPKFNKVPLPKLENQNDRNQLKLL